MKGKIVRILNGMLCAVLVATLFVSVISMNSGNGLQSGSPAGGSPTEVWVDDDFDSSTPGWGVDHFDVIQDGVDAVAEGGTVYVYNGMYYENVDVGKTIDLTGEDRYDTIIDAGGSGDVIHVSADWVNASGFTLRNSGGQGWPVYDAGIKLHIVQNCTVIDNNASNNSGHGIYLRYSDGNSVTGNNASNNSEYGIHLEDSDGNSVTGNNASNNGYGIVLVDSDGNNITGNNASINDDYNIYLYSSNWNNITGNNASSSIWGSGIHLSSSNWNSIIGNNASSKGEDGIYLFYSDWNSIIGNNASSKGEDGIHLFYSDWNSIIGNNFSSNKEIGIHLSSSNWNSVTGNNASNNSVHGIRLEDSDGNSIIGNNASSNVHGIYVYDSDFNVVDGNTVSSNENGITLSSGDGNTIQGNTVSTNFGYGIYLYSSVNDFVYHNDIIGNTNQAFDDRTDNYWDDGYPSGGNYWSDYIGADSFKGPNQDIPGSDGIGDTPYVIDSDSQDDYPLMESFSPNLPPIAIAGTSLDSGSLRLDGSKSYDPEGDTLTYTWVLIGITDPTFNDVRVGVAPLIDDLVAGEYEVTLRVDDGGKSDTDVMLLGILPKPGKVYPADALADLMDDAQAAGVTGGALQMLQNALDKWNQGDKIGSIKHLTNFIDMVGQDASLSDEDKNELIDKAAIILASMEFG